MEKAIRVQSVGPSVRKITGAPSSFEARQNPLGPAESLVEHHVFSSEKSDNALVLARDLCVLANTALEATSDVTLDGTGAYGRKAAAVSFLCRVFGQSILQRFDSALADQYLQYLEKVVSFPLKDLGLSTLTPEEAYGFQTHLGFRAVLSECRALAERLNDLIKYRSKGFLLESHQVSLVRINDETGRVEQRPIAPLGPLQDLLDRVLKHPKLDARRFRRCEVCRDFFYQPRHASRACSIRCDNALRARKHYHDEKERRRKALELHAAGKPIHKIAEALGINTARVRRYLTNRRGRHDGTQTKRG